MPDDPFPHANSEQETKDLIVVDAPNKAYSSDPE